MWFSSFQDLFDISIRSIVCFAGLVILLRVSGKRTLTKMNAFDFIITFAIGSTLASIITSKQLHIAEGMTALSVMIGIQYLIAWLEVRSDWFQQLIKSKPTILFQDDSFCKNAMRKERITEMEIYAALRYHGLSDTSQAELVLLETDGRLSVIPRRQEQTPEPEQGAVEIIRS